MKNLFTIVFIFISVHLFSQEFSRNYGKIMLPELTFKKYAKDTNAEAVMIYDIGESRFYITDNGFELNFSRSVKIRILKKSGIKWGEVEIPYYYEGEILEKVYDIEATSYNIETNGEIKKTVLNVNTVYDEKLNEYWRIKKFAIPNVREGSIVEFKYNIRSPYLFNLRDWEFQRSIPIVYSEYTTLMTPFYEYIYIVQGKTKFDIYEAKEDGGFENQFGSIKYRDMIYKFGMKDVPAFNDESFVTSDKDYLWKMDFQLAKVHQLNGSVQEVISTWPKLCNDLLKEPKFGKYCNVVEKSAGDILNLKELSAKSKLTQLENIVDLVKRTYSWNGNSSKYATKTLKEFQKEKTGNCANINLYLAGLLKGAGLEAYPILISTRDNGTVYKDYPFLHFFNYVVVIVNIDGKFFLTDATEPLCPFNRIPSRCLNNMGLIIKKDAEEWAKLINPEISKIEEFLSIKVNPLEDSLNLNIFSIYSIYEAFDHKSKFKNDIAEISKSLNNKGYYSIDSLTTENYDSTKNKYIVKYKASTPMVKIEEKIYVSPFLSEVLSANPLKQTTRTYPVDFTYPFGKKFTTEIIIPDGYKVEFVPAPLIINNAMVSVDYKTITSEENKITISGNYSFKKAVYEATEYSNLKYVYNEIIKKFNEKVILTKI